jgi:proline iminopeptidase
MMKCNWFLTGLVRFLPEAWNMFAAATADKSAQGLLRDYEQRVQADGRSRRGTLDRVGKRGHGRGRGAIFGCDRVDTPGGALAPRAACQLHYLVHHCFLGAKPLLSGLDAMQHLPAILIQGRRDLVCPPLTAYTVAQRWRAAELRMVEGRAATRPCIRAW